MSVDRNQVCRMRLFIKLHPKVTRASREVFQEMLSLYSIRGKVFPSYKALALRARCAEKTVGRALLQLQAIGILEWRRRRRQPNVYRVVFETAGVGPSAPPVIPAKPARPSAVVPVTAVAAPDFVSEIGGSLAAFAALFEARRAAGA